MICPECNEGKLQHFRKYEYSEIRNINKDGKLSKKLTSKNYGDLAVEFLECPDCNSDFSFDEDIDGRIINVGLRKLNY